VSVSAQWEISTFSCQNSRTFAKKLRFWQVFFKMPGFSVAFWMAMLGIWGLEYDLLGMLEGAVIRISYTFFQVN
jgi:hypothetical protein